MCKCVCVVCSVCVSVCIRTYKHPRIHTLFGVVANNTRYPHTMIIMVICSSFSETNRADLYIPFYNVSTPTLPTLIRSFARLQAILRRHRVRPGACANRQTYQSAIAPVITRYVRTYFRTSIRTHVRAHIRAYRQTARQSDRQTDVDM